VMQSRVRVGCAAQSGQAPALRALAAQRGYERFYSFFK